MIKILRTRRNGPGALLVAAMLLPLVAGAWQATVSMEEYAYGFTIQERAQGDIYSISLPLSVYQSVSDPGLRDTVVVDRKGRPVTRTFRAAPKKSSNDTRRYELAALPMYADATPDAQDIRLLFERDGAKSRLELTAPPESGVTGDAPRVLTEYIFDASGISGSAQELELDWGDSATGFLAQVTIEGSKDLTAWRKLGSGAIADLSEGGAVIQRSSVAVNTSGFGYLRLRWSALPETWRLARVSAVQKKVSRTRKSESIDLTVSSRSEDGKFFFFDLGGYPPVDSARLVPVGDNTVLSGVLSAKIAGDDSWRPVKRGSFYRLGRSGVPLISEASKFNAERYRYWRFQIERGDADAGLALSLSWQPESLLFVAQHEGPYTLAAGRSKSKEEGFLEERLYGDGSILNLVSESRPAATAELGSRFDLAGSDARKVQVLQKDELKRWLLWLGLILGVAIVVLMAVRLIRELNQSKE